LEAPHIYNFVGYVRIHRFFSFLAVAISQGAKLKIIILMVRTALQ